MLIDIRNVLTGEPCRDGRTKEGPCATPDYQFVPALDPIGIHTPNQLVKFCEQCLPVTSMYCDDGD